MRTPVHAIAVVLALSLVSCAEAPRVKLPPDGARPLGWVDVLVGSGDVVVVACDGDYLVADSSGATRERRLDLREGGELSLRSGQIVLAGRTLGPGTVELRPDDGSVLSCEGTRYRGLLRVEVHDDGERTALRVMNRLHVDEYLMGVLPGEMPDRFGIEALAAQAVAARSYVLAEIGRRGWVFPDQRSQVYGGLDVETPMSRRAIELTGSQVLTYQGDVITAWFHSTCGGATSPARLAFNFPPVGIMESSVICPDCEHSPTWSWTRRVDAARVCRVFGLPAGPLTAVLAEPQQFPAIPERIRLSAGGTSVTVSAKEFRARLSAGQPFAAQVLSPRWGAAARIEDGELVLSGRGWGHGVGLCQYGAGGYASRGAGYREILKRYYPRAELIQLI
jgi:stage II sporulation protein D